MYLNPFGGRWDFDAEIAAPVHGVVDRSSCGWPFKLGKEPLWRLH